MTSEGFTGWRKASHSAANGNCVEIGWRKASYSAPNGNCVEVGGWRKSSYSAPNGNCVEVAAGQLVVGVRDTKEHGRGPVVEFPAAAWLAFIETAKSGAFRR
jgi:hypothetical protein